MATNLEKDEYDERDTNMAVNSRINASEMTVWCVSITSLY